MDVHNVTQRSFNMSRIRRSDTKPEVSLRKMVWRSGLRGYRKDAKITGRPDILFIKAKLAIFIDGCFWHMCKKCFIAPRSNVEFWNEKLGKNVKRDREINKKLKMEGYKVIRFWEHEVESDSEYCVKRLRLEVNSLSSNL